MPAISQETVDLILQLAAEGVPQVEIAARTGVSAPSVSAIVNGTRKRRRWASKTITIRSPFSAGSSPKRCPGCGGKVKMPCKKCAVDALKEEMRSARA